MNLAREFASEPCCIERQSSVYEAAQTMESKHVGSLVVTEDGTPVGLVTDRDIAMHALASGAGEDSVERCMGAPFLSIPAETTVRQAAQELRRHDLRRLGLVEPDGRLVGVVTADELYCAVAALNGALAGAIQREFRTESYETESNYSVFGKE